ncbi:hypothetical protein ACFL3Y_01380 [Pseudomonadota bacterium]
MGKDGIASWCAAIESADPPWGESLDSFSFDNIFHQVRHPLEVIPSVCTFREASLRFICRHTPCSIDEPVVLIAAKYWYYWNIEAEKRANWRYRIENLPYVYDEFCLRLGVTCDRSALESVPTDVNTRRNGRIVHVYDELLERLSLKNATLFRNTLKKRACDDERSALTWESLDLLDSKLCIKIRAKATEYGYKV